MSDQAQKPHPQPILTMTLDAARKWRGKLFHEPTHFFGMPLIEYVKPLKHDP